MNARRKSCQFTPSVAARSLRASLDSVILPELLERDIREFRCLVNRLTPKQIDVLEPLSFTVPSLAQPYCCYIRCVIFYVWPYVTLPTRNFLEWDAVEYLLTWDTNFIFNNQIYRCGGGQVIRHRKGWWMVHRALLHEDAYTPAQP